MSRAMKRRTFLAAALAMPALASGGYAGWRSRNNPYYDGPVSANFDGERFFLDGHTSDAARMDLLRWRLMGERPDWPDPEQAPATARDLPPARVNGAIRASYIGHASVLVQAHGVNLLIDPVWSDRASPVQWTGPLRVNPPGVDFSALPPIDAVLVSHNHYDHFDLATLSRLAAAHRPRVLTPLGNDAIMTRADPAIRAEAFDWGARTQVGPGVFVRFEPAYHWSARNLVDRRMALWCSFVIETPSGNIYHIADTGFGDGALFRAAGETYGPFALAIIPIGAYAPRWFMKRHHIDPAEAVEVMQACRAERAMAHHWGTFRLGDEPFDEPPRLLGDALAKANIDARRFRAIRPGQTMEIARAA